MSEGKSSESKFEDPASESKSSSEAESKFTGREASRGIVERAKAYCFSHKFISVFEKFIKDNAELFFDAVETEEHKLGEYALRPSIWGGSLASSQKSLLVPLFCFQLRHLDYNV